jgi:hypothetical protein
VTNASCRGVRRLVAPLLVWRENVSIRGSIGAVGVSSRVAWSRRASHRVRPHRVRRGVGDERQSALARYEHHQLAPHSARSLSRPPDDAHHAMPVPNSVRALGTSSLAELRRDPPIAGPGASGARDRRGCGAAASVGDRDDESRHRCNGPMSGVDSSAAGSRGRRSGRSALMLRNVQGFNSGEELPPDRGCRNATDICFHHRLGVVAAGVR